MNRSALRSPDFSILVLGLILMGGMAAAAADETPRLTRLTRQARANFQAVAPPQAARCQSCAAAHQKCFATCFAGGDEGQMSACLTRCNNAAAACTCDEPVSLRSEDLVALGLASLPKNGCGGSVSCPPEYGSCAGWSEYSQCGAPYCENQIGCGECTCDEFGICFCGWGPARHVPYERYRVCFDQFGNSCTEWYKLVIYNCGC